jgi:hypothetical protein
VSNILDPLYPYNQGGLHYPVITTQPNTAPNPMYYTQVPNTSVNPMMTIDQNVSPNLKVKGDAEFEGDITLNGKSLSKVLESIQDRLAILQPDPKKLAKYEALKKAYDHYKLMEKLIQDDE